MFSHLDEVEMSRRYRKDHDLMGVEAEDMVSTGAGLPERDLFPLFYPHDKDIEKVGVRGIYLGNFIRWDSKAQHEQMIDRYGYETATQGATFDTYNDVDCVHYSGLHDLVKRRKLGYGKAVDHACREIRLRRLDRNEAIDLVRDCEERPVEDGNKLFAWLGISESYFWQLVDRAGRNPDSSGRFSALPEMVARHRLGVIEPCNFRVTASRGNVVDPEDYRLIARGYVDGVPAPGFATALTDG